ncbi:MAG: DEAD/DEAH box helicase, partial [Acidimicrobiales bacterium]
GGAAGGGGTSTYSVRWAPALVERSELDALSRSMPPPVAALAGRADARALTTAVLEAVVDAVGRDAGRRLELPAAPPVVRTAADVAETMLTTLDGTPFSAPTRLGASLADRLERWVAPVSGAVDARLVVQLDPPDKGGAWFLSVLGPGQEGTLVPLEVALVDGHSKRHLADDAARLERLLPVLNRPGGKRRGEVVLSQDEAFELMGVTGPALAAAGFDVRVPGLSRRRPRPSLRLTAEPVDATMVGAAQLASVRWSAVFDDVELTAEDIRRLAAEARPLIHSRGRWVELDRVDLNEAAAALAERATRTRMSGAEVLRHAIGLEDSPLAGGTTVGGHGWAVDLLARTRAASASDVTVPDGFVGTLRSYQLEALAWLGFLDGAGLGGCLALDMGLGKTPTMLAHIARSVAAGGGPTLVVAPTAVVGNWAAEAARFTPGLRVVVHHGSSRASVAEFADEVAGADVVITTYGTAVRDVEALEREAWGRIVLDEAQAVKNPASEAAQQLRLIPAASRVALTGTPVENGLGDLWAILDFTNPGLVGARSAFVGALSAKGGDAAARAEGALRALNGILLFRRTKAEPEVAAELPDKIDQLDHCTMTPEQVGLYQAVLDRLAAAPEEDRRQGDVLAAITALKQICDHPAAYQHDGRPLAGRSGKLARLEEIVESVFEAGEKLLVFTHFAEWGVQLAGHLSERTGMPIGCYHGGLSRGARDRLVEEFQGGRQGPGALVLSLKAGGTGLNLTAASHVVLYDRWWNPAVEDQARDRAWRLGQERTVVSHRLVCPGTVDERVEDVVAGKRHIADLVLPKSSSLADLDPDQLRVALGLRPGTLLTAEPEDAPPAGEEAAA